ncbi:MAG TPA: hypothetical protein VFO46_10470 [Candidatus Sulfotelmatobacter sp.]|nr:hypothetical protein [Candidatus Sulfotelmatobacter sp.]
MDAPWIGKVVGILVLVVIGGLLWLSHTLEKRGRFKNYSRGLGRGLLAADEMLRPSKQHVRQAKDEEKEVDEDQGDGVRRNRARLACHNVERRRLAGCRGGSRPAPIPPVKLHPPRAPLP